VSAWKKYSNIPTTSPHILRVIFIGNISFYGYFIIFVDIINIHGDIINTFIALIMSLELRCVDNEALMNTRKQPMKIKHIFKANYGLNVL